VEYLDIDEDNVCELDGYLRDQLRMSIVGDWELRYMTWRSLHDISATLEKLHDKICKADEVKPSVITVSQTFTPGKKEATPAQRRPQGKRAGFPMREPSIPNARRPWTEQNKADLLTALSWGMTDQDIAHMFGRSQDSIRTAREKLGIRKHPDMRGQILTGSTDTHQGETK
jgi:hypothetical protein